MGHRSRHGKAIPSTGQLERRILQVGPQHQRLQMPLQEYDSNVAHSRHQPSRRKLATLSNSSRGKIEEVIQNDQINVL
jgi:hypothetical protein